MAQPESQLALNPWQRWSHRLAWGCVLITLFMIAVGAMVTTTRAGDTNPGWSLKFWEWFTSWAAAEGGRAWEDGHRVIGTVVGFVGIGLAIAMWKGERTSPRRWLGIVALALICFQGLVGGLRVLVVSDAEVRDAVLGMTGGGIDVELRRAIKAMLHGVTAQVIFAGLCVIAILTSPRWLGAWAAHRNAASGLTRKLALAALAFTVVQLGLGTIVRQTGEMVLVHVTGAFVVSTTLIWLLIRLFQHHAQFAPLRLLGGALGFMLVCQVFLGIVPWMLTHGVLVSDNPASLVAILRSSHVTLGAILLATLSVLNLWLHRLAQPADGTLSAADAREFDHSVAGKLRDYAQLTKIRLSGLVMVTVAVGFFVGVQGTPNLATLLLTMIGVSMAAAGVAAINQLMERKRDALMERTRNRPLPSGRMKPAEAIAFGAFTITGGLTITALGANLLAAVLTALTVFTYLCVYTPLKTRTTVNTLVGAIPGALPPMIGYAASSGTVELPSFVLFAILFVWQLPHFWAIARLYREDYERGGMKMLSVVDPEGRFLAGQIALWCLALLVTSLLPVLVGMAGRGYAIAAVALGLGFFASGILNARQRTQRSARVVFLVSIVYLPALLATLLLDLS